MALQEQQFYHPLLDGLGTATSTANIDVLSVYVHSGQFHKYHPELWDIRPCRRR